METDTGLEAVARRVAALGHDLEIDCVARDRLRARLLERHVELSAGRNRAPRGSRLGVRLRRRLLLAPPAVLIATALSVLVWSLQISNNQLAPFQVTNISQALARTVPTVRSWTVVLREQRADSSTAYQCVQQGQRLYVRGSVSYLYRAGSWYQLTGTLAPIPIGHGCTSALQLAFMELPLRLRQPHSYTLVETQHRAGPVGIRFTVHRVTGQRVLATAWVDRSTGLLTRLDQQIWSHGRLVERDEADYLYTRAP